MGPGLGLRLLLVLVGLGAAARSAVPRTARPFPEVQQMVHRFSHEAISNYSIFLVAPQTRTLYVGAKNAIFALPLESVNQPAKMISWEVPKNLRDSCTRKGKKEAECHNYIRILEFADESHLFTCGTFAFDPQCGFIKVANFSSVERQESGRGKCPFEPTQQSAAVMVDPVFVGSTFLRGGESGEDDKIYFFFTETAREYDFYEQVKVPRVARVCKGDLGGLKTLQKRWTTFLKTQLVCLDPESGTNFNLLKDVFTLHSVNGTSAVFYGIFSAQRDGGQVSAVCAYSIRDIQKAMNGRFKEFKHDCDKWTSVMGGDVPEPRPGACITKSMKLAGFGSSLALPDRVLTFVRDHPLMDQVVHPLEMGPVLIKLDTQYLRIAVHRVRSVSGQEYDMLYLGTEDGHLHKAVKIAQKAVVIEDLTLFPEPQPIQSLQLHQSWLYVGSSTEVTQVNITDCERYKSCIECVLGRDPSCAWSRELGACIRHQGQSGLLQDLTSLSILTLCPQGTEDVPVTVEVLVSLAARVVLPCTPPSAWATCMWQRPSQDATVYALHSDGLEFTVTEETLGDYICQCMEGGAGGVVASYSLVRGSSSANAWKTTERNYSVLVGLLLFFLGFAAGSGCFFIYERKRRERLQRELLSRERNGLDLMQSNTTSCSHEPHTPSSPEDERHPLATAKKNGSLNGFPHLYINELDKDQARIYLTGVPLAKCDETSI
ncbi:ecto-ADP-ribosyltransferase 5-like [Platysternon megacephalum]|uniref:Ecto-ADP-ribosyltransferase 5-like n=1 Tax=Platysternon megacephalum TaxID=55544 RepID=A0A4D9DKY4_9SAUR|nr:ecto-ADP-ribosyltransferase 5-like [Platysternon megacephalum]